MEDGAKLFKNRKGGRERKRETVPIQEELAN